MIAYSLLTQLALEALKGDPKTQAGAIPDRVRALIEKRNLFPTQEEAGPDFHSYYREKRLSPDDVVTINQILWDLIVDRVITIGKDSSNDKWPWIRLTAHGERVVDGAGPVYYDPHGYETFLGSITPSIGPVIKQYIMECINCYRQRLYFATAVMIGAAAESCALQLAEAIVMKTTDPAQRGSRAEILDRGKLPKIFEMIFGSLKPLIDTKKIPYQIYQGSLEHLLSLFEMIRVQRNEAVHPVAADVTKEKVFLSIQTLPVALQVVFRLIEWLRANQI
jgi:hypothetical protein